MAQHPPTRYSAILALLLALSPMAHAAAQSTARARAEENVRREPNGEVLARVQPGATMVVVGRQDQWLEVDLEGWVWARSLQVTDRDGLDLIVSAPQGENLRAAPSGEILARVGRGTLLEEIERRPGWIHVRRRVWVWAPSVVETSLSTTSTADRAVSEEPVATAPGAFVSAGARGIAVLSAPDGDTLARTASGADVEVLGREGNWARVRVEGWAWLPGSASPATESRPDGEVGLTPDALKEAPDRYQGRVVSWQLQFISVERAEKVRTDFFDGEPFLLTRFGGPEGPFVYVAVPPERIQEVEGLIPLERVSVTGRVRTGASSLTGTPILDLVTVERVRNQP